MSEESMHAAIGNCETIAEPLGTRLRRAALQLDVDMDVRCFQYMLEVITAHANLPENRRLTNFVLSHDVLKNAPGGDIGPVVLERLGKEERIFLLFAPDDVIQDQHRVTVYLGEPPPPHHAHSYGFTRLG